ncbi:MAG: thiamine-monophosphate kinase, partial [Halobacteriaceae archaeon]
MDELEALELLQQQIPKAGDDCGIIDDTAITTDMLHERTDFPDGISAYTVGWRSLGVSLSDIAAVGADPIGGVAVYAAPAFRKEALQAFLSGAVDICEAVETEYIGGDLDTHSELTVVSTVIGRTTKPVSRSGANIGDHVCVTGTLGRSAAGVEYFQNDTPAKGNEL